MPCHRGDASPADCVSGVRSVGPRAGSGEHRRDVGACRRRASAAHWKVRRGRNHHLAARERRRDGRAACAGAGCARRVRRRSRCCSRCSSKNQPAMPRWSSASCRHALGQRGPAHHDAPGAAAERSAVGHRARLRPGRAPPRAGHSHADAVEERFEEANGLFREASTLAPTDASINTAWGDLFLEKPTRRSGAVLSGGAQGRRRLRPCAPWHGAGRCRREPAGVDEVHAAYELNPNDAAAHLFLADRAVDEDKLEDARAEIAKAAINPRLEAHALKAAIAYVEGKAEESQPRSRRRSRSIRSTAKPIASSAR